MANKLTRNPWILDTASATLLRPTGTSQGTPPMGPIRIASLLFSGYTVATHKAVLADADGTTFLSLVGTSDKTAVGFSFARPVSLTNFALTTLDSGIVTVFLEG